MNNIIIGIFFMIGFLTIITVSIIVFLIITYNNMIKMQNKVKNSWAHIDTQLQRRFDLVPNLVEVVKGYAKHEEKILEKLYLSRDAYMNAKTSDEKISKNAELSSYLKSIYKIAENYPELKSSGPFLQLQNALTEIEEDISYARQFYNDAVTINNNYLMKFPNNIIASIFHFNEATPFDAIKDAENVPKIYFGDKIRQCPVCGASVSADSINCEYCGCSTI